ncbi:MAG: hypothetical protein OXC27_13215, partial [Caldilineaceae bacterium]|nr:hypothetical protein [Caldilineaceae bacterium]
EAGDIAQGLSLQRQANRLTAVMIDHGVTPAMRVALKSMGIDCGPPRLPQEPVSPEKEEIILDELQGAGLAALVAM